MKLLGDPFGGSGPLDPTFNAIASNRGSFGRVLWLFGDSIFRGIALGRFPDEWERSAIDIEPLWSFRSPASMINLVLRDTVGMTENRFGVATSAEYVCCFAGSCGQPSGTEAVANLIRKYVSLEIVRSGDALAFLDAGPHTSDPDLYQAQWEVVRRAVVENSDVTLVMCSAFDDLAADEGVLDRGAPTEVFMYESVWPSASGRRSHNDATRAAALEPMPSVRGDHPLFGHRGHHARLA